MRRAERRSPPPASETGNQPQHVFGRADHDRNDDDGERDAARDPENPAEWLHHQLVDKQADQDRGRREQDVGDEADSVPERRAAGILGEIGADQQPDRRADQRSPSAVWIRLPTMAFSRPPSEPGGA